MRASAASRRCCALGALTREAVAAFGAGAPHFDDIESLLAATALAAATPEATVLVKGSRFMRMERVVRALANRRGQPPGGAH